MSRPKARKTQGQDGYRPENTDVLNAEQTVRLLALPQEGTSESSKDASMSVLHHATFLQVPLGVAYANRDGAILACNAAFEGLLGLTPGEHCNKSIRELTHQDDLPNNDRLLNELWEGQRTSYTLEKRYVRRDPKGQFKESDDVGRSLAADRRQKAATAVKPGHGDRGDRKS